MSKCAKWLFAGIVALVVSCSYKLDGPSDLDMERDVAADVQTAQLTAQTAQPWWLTEVRP